MKILLTGATGFIGKKLGRALVAQGNRVVAPVRDPDKASRSLDFQCQFVVWPSVTAPLPKEALADVEAVIHLAGEPIAEGRWTGDKKKRIRESRTLGTRKLVEQLKQGAPNLKVFISASGVGYYGYHKDQVLKETDRVGSDFLAQVCSEWEAEAKRASEINQSRVVIVRTGMVLGADGGALPKMLPVFKLNLGGKLGTGDQWMSWIHIDDLVGIYIHALSNVAMQGAVNGVAPAPVRNKEFTQVLASAVNAKVFLPVPSFALKLALGELSEVLLLGQRVSAEKIRSEGFEFKHPDLPGALKEILQEKS